MNPNPYTDLYQALTGTLSQKGCDPTPCHIGMFWSNLRPAEIALSIRIGEQIEPWNVSRNTFIAAALPWALGAWMGAGDFSVCYAGPKALLALAALRPGGAIIIAETGPVTDFIDHTVTLLPPGEAESAIIVERLDAELARILDGP